MSGIRQDLSRFAEILSGSFVWPYMSCFRT